MISLESWECVRQGKPYTEEAILYDLQLLGGAVMTQQEMCERWHIKARETVRKILRALSVKGKIVLITTSAKTAINLPKTDIVPRPNCQRVANELPTGCQQNVENIGASEGSVANELPTSCQRVANDTHPTSVKHSRDIQIDLRKFVEYFNGQIAKNNSIIKPVAGLTKNRSQSIMARAREHGRQSLSTVAINAATSDFLNGKNDKGWVATFDWIFRPNNFIKVLEGAYGNNNTSGQSPVEQREERQIEQALNAMQKLTELGI